MQTQKDNNQPITQPECGICNKINIKFKKLKCSKVCASSHKICRDCYKIIELDGCPFCRQNTYFPYGKEQYFVNVGIIHEFEDILHDPRISKRDTTKQKMRNILYKCNIAMISQKFLFFDQINKIDTEKRMCVSIHNSFSECYCHIIHSGNIIDDRMRLYTDLYKQIKKIRKYYDGDTDYMFSYIHGRMKALKKLKIIFNQN